MSLDNITITAMSKLKIGHHEDGGFILKYIALLLMLISLIFGQCSSVSAKDAALLPKLYVAEELVDADTIYVNGVPYISAAACLDACSKTLDVMADGDELQAVGSFAKSQVYAITAKVNDKYVNVNGRYIYVGLGVKKLNEKVALPLATIAKIFDGTLTQESKGSNKYFLELGKYSMMLGSKFYSEYIVDLMAHTIYSEAGNQCLEGQIAVGNVILRRVKSASFPNSVYQVIHSDSQFDGVETAQFEAEPTESCYIASKIALEGTEMLPGAMYFNTADLNSWARRTRTYLGTIQGHDFFK